MTSLLAFLVPHAEAVRDLCAAVAADVDDKEKAREQMRKRVSARTSCAAEQRCQPPIRAGRLLHVPSSPQAAVFAVTAAEQQDTFKLAMCAPDLWCACSQ